MRESRDTPYAAPEIHDAGRRRLLQGLAALAASAGAPAAFAQATGAALTPARFAALSSTLTGFAYQDPALAATLLAALSDAVGADALAKIATLAAATPPARLADELRIAGLDQKALAVIVALYSGTVTTAQGTTVFTYENALAWRAVPWTKPNADCGGLTNYWAKAPGA